MDSYDEVRLPSIPVHPTLVEVRVEVVMGMKEKIWERNLPVDNSYLNL